MNSFFHVYANELLCTPVFQWGIGSSVCHSKYSPEKLREVLGEKPRKFTKLCLAGF